jgi:hypothetical protein
VDVGGTILQSERSFQRGSNEASDLYVRGVYIDKSCTIGTLGTKALRQGISKKKTVTASFRIDEESFAALQEEARRHLITVNALVNQLLSVYARSDRFAGGKVLKVPDYVFREMVGSIPDDKLARLGRKIALEYSKVGIAQRYGEFSWANVLRATADIAQYGGFGTYSERHTPRGRLAVTLTHNLGRGYSTMFGGCFQAFLDETGVKAKLVLTETGVLVELLDPSL